ncbi:MAG: hypothetical protein JO199_01585 [Candidatus Eremiobacteraeota bacterium]|nr:hypothetical protein [Candidatus Eremiobacteraeota bacterium]
MDFENRLIRIVSDGKALPTFEQWLDASGYRRLADRICLQGTLRGKLMAMRSLYGYYKADLRNKVS